MQTFIVVIIGGHLGDRIHGFHIVNNDELLVINQSKDNYFDKYRRSVGAQVIDAEKHVCKRLTTNEYMKFIPIEQCSFLNIPIDYHNLDSLRQQKYT